MIKPVVSDFAHRLLSTSHFRFLLGLWLLKFSINQAVPTAEREGLIVPIAEILTCKSYSRVRDSSPAETNSLANLVSYPESLAGLPIPIPLERVESST
ncbi:unnamed protein product [Somion occarium]|uniref:Uncharacterized protein n=1 Tax=Somion occarium TaxID=3059160 RepID=A0ABP1E7X5_9APHY